MSNVVLCLDLVKRNLFSYGQVYVALNKANSLRGLTTNTDFKKDYMKAHPDTITEYEKLRNERDCLVAADVCTGWPF